jgi:hypothetical protein
VISIHHNYFVAEKEEWRDATAFVREHAGEGELLIFVPGYAEMPFMFYGAPGLETRGFPFDESLVHAEPRSLDDLTVATGAASAVWLILSHAEAVDPNGEVKAWLDANATLVLEKAFFEITVLKYELPAASAIDLQLPVQRQLVGDRGTGPRVVDDRDFAITREKKAARTGQTSRNEVDHEEGIRTIQLRCLLCKDRVDGLES